MHHFFTVLTLDNQLKTVLFLSVAKKRFVQIARVKACVNRDLTSSNRLSFSKCSPQKRTL